MDVDGAVPPFFGSGSGFLPPWEDAVDDVLSLQSPRKKIAEKVNRKDFSLF